MQGIINGSTSILKQKRKENWKVLKNNWAERRTVQLVKLMEDNFL
jgi:hypothetical protein